VTVHHLHTIPTVKSGVVAASCCGGVFKQQGLIGVEGKLNAEKYRESLGMDWSTQNL